MLDRIEVQGLTDTPSFTVTSSSHQAQLRTQFHAVVNGENGDTFLEKVAATFWKTTVWADGSVAGKPGTFAIRAWRTVVVNPVVGPDGLPSKTPIADPHLLTGCGRSTPGGAAQSAEKLP